MTTYNNNVYLSIKWVKFQYFIFLIEYFNIIQYFDPKIKKLPNFKAGKKFFIH